MGTWRNGEEPAGIERNHFTSCRGRHQNRVYALPVRARRTMSVFGVPASAGPAVCFDWNLDFGCFSGAWCLIMVLPAPSAPNRTNRSDLCTYVQLRAPVCTPVHENEKIQNGAQAARKCFNPGALDTCRAFLQFPSIMKTLFLTSLLLSAALARAGTEEGFTTLFD